MLPYNARTQEDFLKAAYEFYFHKYGFDSFGVISIKTRDDLIEHLYKLGRDLNILPMSFYEFKTILLGQHRNYYNGVAYRYNYHYRGWYYYYRRHRRYGGRNSHFCDPKWYRVLVSFTYSGQEKKAIDNSWREYKKIQKDKGKYEKRRFPWKKTVKFYSSRGHRRFEKRCIKQERYDDLHSRTYKQIVDPWSWD